MQDVKVMKYLFTLKVPNENRMLIENPEAAKKGIKEIIEKIKPEAMYFSTIRRLIFLVINVEDPHVELRQIFENLSNWGNLTVDPVSTSEQFNTFMDSQ